MSESEYGPFERIVWVETYHVPDDCVVAAPQYFSWQVQRAIKNGYAIVLTEKEAKARNAATSARRPEWKQYIDQILAIHWRFINAQRNLT